MCMNNSNWTPKISFSRKLSLKSGCAGSGLPASYQYHQILYIKYKTRDGVRDPGKLGTKRDLVGYLYLCLGRLDYLDVGLMAVVCLIALVALHSRDGEQRVTLATHQTHLNLAAGGIVSLLHRDDALQVRLLDGVVADRALTPIVVRQSCKK